ncbi:MAG TPA: hypothetical protein VF939_26770 [Puia sp.]
MPNKILLPFLLAISLFTSFAPRDTTTAAQTEYVYLCEGPYSKVYHKAADCRGLSNCSTKIYKVTLEEAVKMGRRPCKIEYK